MNLTNAMRTASSSLNSISSQTALVSRNIAGASDSHYSRKNANLVTNLNGVGQIGSITRVTDIALRTSALVASSSAASSQALADGYNQLDQITSDASGAESPSAMLSALTDQLQKLAATPGNPASSTAVLRSAQDMASSLNSATSTVQGVRKQADSAMIKSVQTVNSLLQQFRDVDTAIIRGKIGGADTSGDEDTRDQILSGLSQELGISSVTRGNGSTAIYTDGGVVLFDREPRVVSLGSTASFVAGTAAQAVKVDGVDVTSVNSVMPLQSGRLAGLAKMRDTISVQFQAQLDETARGLINAFAEKDQSATPTQPDASGIFTWTGGPALPGGARIDGLAAQIRVNPTIDPAQGGNVNRIRDGGAADPLNLAYVYNSSGAASYTARIEAMTKALANTISFDPAAGAASSGTLASYTTESISFVEAGRKAETSSATQQTTLRDSLVKSLRSETGVSLDDEMSKMLDLEHAYSASGKLISAIDNMFTSLLQTIGRG